MKLTTLVLVIALVQASAKEGFSQITLHANHAPLATVLQSIKQQTGYVFVIGDIDLTQQQIDVNVKNVSINKALDICFKDLSLDYKIEDKTVFIKQREPSILDKLKAIIVNTDVHGRVLADDGQPLAGATVQVKGGNNATTTDVNGYFVLANIDPNATLVVSFIGYEKKEIKAAANLGNIQLKLAESKLDEVKVIAYGQTTERLSIGNISSVSAKQIEEQPVANPLLALEGRVPGVFIQQATGLSGSGVTVLIQGQNSFRSGNDPYYVIDGVPYISQLSNGLGAFLGTSGVTNAHAGNPFSFINPADIENITVLKDADATAIYGSRAANGAILITTKKAKAGQTQVNFDLQQGRGTVGHMMSLLNTPQYLQMRHEALKNDGATAGSFDYDINGLWDTTKNTNWQKVLLGGTAQYTNFNGTVSGGTENLQYLVGGTWHRETTVFPGNFADDKGSLHFSLNNVSTNRKFRLQLSANYLVDNNHLSQTDLTSFATGLAPNAPALYNANGSLNWEPDADGNSSWTNPLAELNYGYSNLTTNLVSNMVLSYRLLPGLDLRSSFGYTNLQTNETTASPLTTIPPEYRSTSTRGAQFSNSNINSWIVEPQLSYKINLGKGTLDALLGSTFNQQNTKGYAVTASGFNSDQVIGDINSAATLTRAGSVESVYKYTAVFGRLNYNWEGKYLVDLTVRRDGSSRFGAGNQFHNFGAGGIGWIFSEEKLVKDALPLLSFGKLRASYGTTGNDQIGDYSFLNLYKPIAAAVPYQGVIGLAPTNLPNPYLQWEETKKFNIGADIGILHDRILVNANYFINRSSNELLGYALPSIAGFTSITKNFQATVQNSGLELTINSINIKSKDFEWTSNINLTLPKNKLVAYPGLATSGDAKRYVIGQPITITKKLQFAGVDPTTGVYQFVNVNGVITANPDYSTDLISVINTAPTLYGGFSNTIRYKRIELDFTFQAVKRLAIGNDFGYYIPGLGEENQPTAVLNRWQKQGDVTTIQRYNSDYSLGDSWENVTSSNAAYKDASYIRLKNVSLSWRLPDNWCKKMHLQNVSIYVQGQNLWTITSYVGMDPETLSVTTLPLLKVITTGIKIGL